MKNQQESFINSLNTVVHLSTSPWQNIFVSYQTFLWDNRRTKMPTFSLVQIQSSKHKYVKHLHYWNLTEKQSLMVQYIRI